MESGPTIFVCDLLDGQIDGKWEGVMEGSSGSREGRGVRGGLEQYGSNIIWMTRSLEVHQKVNIESSTGRIDLGDWN